MTTPATHTVALWPDLQPTMTEAGAGRSALILRGGGPATVATIADKLQQVLFPYTETI